MSRFNCFSEFLAFVALAAVALTLPVAAEEITVTVPPGLPAQEAASPTSSALPSFAADESLKTSQAAGDDTADQETPAASPAPPPSSPPSVEHKAEKKHPAVKAKSGPASETKAGQTAGATTKPLKPKPKTKGATKTKHTAKKQPACSGLGEAACGGNKACKWTTPSAKAGGSSQPAPAHCMAAARAKKKHSAKKAEASATEVLPWEKKADAAASDSKPASNSNAKHAKTAKTKKSKTTAKKSAKPKAEAVPTVPVTSGSADELPWSESTASPGSQ